VMCSWTE